MGEIEHLHHFVRAVAVVLHVDVAAQHFGERLVPQIALRRVALVILVPLVPLLAIGLRGDERRTVAGHVAHPGGRTAAVSIHALGILTARHLQPIVRAGKLHLLHRARRDELQHRAATADEIGGPRERLDRRDTARDRERDLRILRPERMLGPHLGRHRARGLVAVRFPERAGRGVHADVRVRVDHAGRHPLARAIDDRRVGRRRDVRAHRDDPAVTEQN